MEIEGTVIMAGREYAGRKARAAEREAAQNKRNATDAHRQLMYKVNEARGKVGGAELEVARMEREAADLQVDIEEAQAELERTGRRDPEMAAMRFAACQSPEVIQAARKRLDVAKMALADIEDQYDQAEVRIAARAAAEAEVDRLAAEREAAIIAASERIVAASKAPTSTPEQAHELPEDGPEDDDVPSHDAVAEAPSRGRGRPPKAGLGAH